MSCVAQDTLDASTEVVLRCVSPTVQGVHELAGPTCTGDDVEDRVDDVVVFDVGAHEREHVEMLATDR